MGNGDAQTLAWGIQGDRPWLPKQHSLRVSRDAYNFSFFSWHAWTDKATWSHQPLNTGSRSRDILNHSWVSMARTPRCYYLRFGLRAVGFKGTGSQVLRWTHSEARGWAQERKHLCNPAQQAQRRFSRPGMDGFDRANWPTRCNNSELVVLHFCYRSVQQNCCLTLPSHMWVVLAVKLAEFHSTRHT